MVVDLVVDHRRRRDVELFLCRFDHPPSPEPCPTHHGLLDSGDLSISAAVDATLDRLRLRQDHDAVVFVGWIRYPINLRKAGHAIERTHNVV